MDENPIISCGGILVTLDDLRKDVEGAKRKNLSNQWAFTPETVEGLIDLIDQLTAHNKQLHEQIETLQEIADRVGDLIPGLNEDHLGDIAQLLKDTVAKGKPE